MTERPLMWPVADRRRWGVQPLSHSVGTGARRAIPLWTRCRRGHRTTSTRSPCAIRFGKQTWLGAW